MDMKRNKKGIIYILCAAFFFSLMTFFVKLSGDVPTMQKCFFRNLPAVLIMAIVLFRSDEKFHVKKESWIPLLIRCISGTSGIVLNFWAIDHLALPDANILNKMSPVFAMILSVFILKEKASKVDWLMVAVALAGAVFVVKPTAGIASVNALIGLCSGFGAGLAYTFVRKMGSYGERGPAIVFYFSVFSCVTTLPLFIFDYSPISLKQFLILMCAGMGGAMGQIFITAAYKAAPAKEISVFDYTQVIFAALLGIIFLNELPDALSFVGYAVIIGSAVVKWLYANRKVQKT